jgi:hypothetical protein
VTSTLRIVVTGLLAQHPLGGVTWDYLQYPLGLARLGHDVWYLEDSGEWPYDVNGPGGRASSVEDCSANLERLRSVMDRIGLADRWMYRCPIGSTWFGLADAQRESVIGSADLLLNVSGTLHRPERYRSIPRLAYVDSDPVFTQVKIASGAGRFPARVDQHDVHFSFGERIGESLSEAVPRTRFDWQPTRQPIVLSEWPRAASGRSVYTTVLNWASYAAPSYNGCRYGQKNVEFAHFMELPELVAPVELEVAVKAVRRRGKPTAPVERMQRLGWRVVSPDVVCPDLDSYREYITSSRGEWSVAKHGYVVGQPGWFSCRSACYLAAGRPVVVQDTGFADVLPVGEGIVAFRTLDEAVDALADVESRYAHHSRAAREIAEEYFDSNRVLGELIDRAMQSAS